MSTGRVIVVAPDPAFRRSIAFALRSGGFDALSFASLDEAAGSPQFETATCMVVDEEAVGDRDRARIHFARFGRPVVLLAGLLSEAPVVPVATCILKPFLGEPLIRAVRDLSRNPS